MFLRYIIMTMPLGNCTGLLVYLSSKEPEGLVCTVAIILRAFLKLEGRHDEFSFKCREKNFKKV